jgi:hypothetical protein
MNYFGATFFDRYTPLTDEQIQLKLTPTPAAKSSAPASGALAGKTIKIILDGGPVLEYVFAQDKLTLRENGGAAVSAPYSVKELEEILLLTHMIPDTARGYSVVLDRKTDLVTVFEVWFGGYERDKREVWRSVSFGYIDCGMPAPEKRHTLTNRIEGTGTYWKNDDGTEQLYFFPSVIWSSFVELSDPRGGITKTAPSDYIKINDRFYIYSRVEQEFSGGFTLEVIDFFTVRHIGVRLGFDLYDALDYRVYSGTGEVTGRSANLEPLNDYGTELPDDERLRMQILPSVKGSRPSYRPKLAHHDYTKAQVDEIIRNNCKVYEGQSIMSSFNAMERSDYMAGKRFTLNYDDGPVWEYDIIDAYRLKWRAAGEKSWHEEIYQGFEPAKDILLFCHICTGSDPFRCLIHTIDFSNALVTCVDAQIGNGRKAWEVGQKAAFGVLEIEGGPTPPAVKRHGFTTELLGKAFSWAYSDTMQSIHVYSSPESYSWTIMHPNNAGGWMWSSPCFYVKLRDDAYLMSWTEDACNGNLGTFIVNPRIMHDSGFFFGIGGTEEEPDVHLTAMGAFARPLGGFDLMRYYGKKRQ